VRDLSRYAFSPLRAGEFALQRGSANGLAPVLLLTAENASRANLKRIEHEYGLRSSLDAAWAVQPIELSSYRNRLALLLEDPGGVVLDRVLGRPLEIASFLRVAIALAGALHQAHARGLIHKDIKPANILVDMEGGSVWLTGFGIASRLPRERTNPEPPEVIAGTLAYMAPEQTGRMNRSIDARSDLYSLGITFYEMLTGTLPFIANDPLEWVHCHVGRHPAPLVERRAETPAALSLIVMKLLAKTAEERYQTAAGLEADLRQCLAQWEAHGRIDSFPIGTRDVSGRLLIPENLYGREREIDALTESFERVVALGTTELLLISGYAGVGKSSVVQALHKVLVQQRGLFVSGKFDQYKRDVPYAMLAQALQGLIQPLLGLHESELVRWREGLRDALGPNAKLMVDLVPELKLITGEPQPVPELAPQQAKSRFQLVLKRLLGVFARPEHPLVLFLDDLQWLDPATLDLVEDLLTQQDVRHLLLIGAYRDNELRAGQPLLHKLEAIRQSRVRVQEIRLAPLTHEDVQRMVVDALRCEPEPAAPLAQLIYQKTGGNPFFAIQFLHALDDEGLLTFDHGSARWCWNLDHIHAKGYTDNVVDLMVDKLNRLPEATKAVLQLLACLGNAADIDTLILFRATPKETIHAELWEAVRQDLILRSDDGYKFVHDRIQEAAYTLIPTDARAAVHLRIGRLLAARTPPQKPGEVIFEIVNHLNRGIALITAPEGREQLAELNLSAAKRAKSATANATALTYLVAGVALLPQDAWKTRHDLVFALELHRAECEFLTGALAEAEARLASLSTFAATTLERAAVACLRVDLYTTLDQASRAIAVGLDYLRHLGIDWSPHPTEDEARSEYERIWSQLGGRKIETLIDLPRMSDPASLATTDVLIKLGPPALYTDENLFALVTCRPVNLSLEYGNCDSSCIAYIRLSMVASRRFGDYGPVYRFGQLGYDLVVQRGFTRFQARTYMDYGNIVLPWTRHVREARTLLHRTFEAANEIGDLTYAAYCCHELNVNLLAVGDPLSEAQREAERGLAFAQQARFGFVIDVISTQLALIRSLRGLTTVFGCFDDEQFEERFIEHRYADNPDLKLGECWYWIRKLQARFFAGDYESAVDASSQAQRVLWTSPSLFEAAEYHFYGALSRAACCDSASAGPRRQHLDAVAAHHKQLELWAADCPENFENRAHLVGAEIARLQGRELDAERLYEQAIRSARANGFIHNEALANELAARFHAARGFERFALVYLRDARYGYLRWGADGKVRQLEQLHPGLAAEGFASSPKTVIDAPVDQLDVGAVIKATQAVSSEVELAKLIKTLLRITIEHAGAERGLLILFKAHEPRIAAATATRDGNIEVMLRDSAVVPTELIESVFHAAVRTMESVILDNASTQDPFCTDEYVRNNHVRSVLCQPLVKQTKLVGMLYLENNMTSHVFTSSKLAVLKMLAAQAAIALENAQLYDELRTENSERRRADTRLLRNEAYLAEAQRLSHTGSFGWKPRSGEIYWTNETFGIFEYDRANSPTLELILRRVHPDDAAAFRQVAERAAANGQDFSHEYRLRMPDGRVKHIHVVARGSLDDTGDVDFVGAMTDVTDRKKSEQSFKDLLEAAPDAMVILNHQGGIVLVNSQTERLFGYPRSELLEEPVEMLLPERYREKHSAHREGFFANPHVRSMGGGLELHGIRRNGTEFPVEISLSPIETAEGLLVISAIRDITERKHAEDEREQLEQRVRQGEKMEAVGRVAAGIAHDFNGVLAGVFAYGEMLFEEVSEHSQLKRYAQNVLAAAGRGRDLVEQILTYSRSHTGKRGLVDFARVTAEALELTRGSLPAGIHLETSSAPTPLVVVGDATRLHQIVMNLCSNAIQAASAGGTVRVALESVDLPDQRAFSTGLLNRGHYVRLTVEDNGIGMDAKTLSRIFEPFFTTKEIGRGTGLGLSLVYAIVTDGGGAVDVRSVRDEGSRFAIYIPRAQGALISMPEAETSLPHGNGERVLLVDDDPNILTVMAEVLSRLGYEPVPYSDGRVALAAFEAAPKSFDAVVTDEVMPGLTGTGLASVMRLQRGDLPIVLASGSRDPMLAQRALAAGVSELLVKPLQFREIAAALARLLNAGR